MENIEELLPSHVGTSLCSYYYCLLGGAVVFMSMKNSIVLLKLIVVVGVAPHCTIWKMVSNRLMSPASSCETGSVVPLSSLVSSQVSRDRPAHTRFSGKHLDRPLQSSGHAR